MEAMLAETVHPGSKEIFRDFPLNRINLGALEVLRERKKSLPGAASDRVKALRALFKWATAQKHCLSNPALALNKIRITSEGHHTWTAEEIAQFEARHPTGTKANLALQILLYTGARRSDAVSLGRQHVQGTALRWTAYKNRNRFPVTIQIPLLHPLAAAIDAGPTGDLVFLVTEYGKPFTIAGFGNWFKDRCREAGLRHCSAHGLRKAGSSRAAEAGATAHQLMAMFGWRSLAEAELYTKAAERKLMAAAGMQYLLKGVARSGSVPLSEPKKSGGTNRQKT
jgi:integrase